jgi:hypothetical protein
MKKNLHQRYAQRIALQTTLGLPLLFLMAVACDREVRGKEPSTVSRVWKTYTNVRFQYSLCYPEDLFTPQGEVDNGDGQRFLAKSGAQLTVFGWNNALNQSLQDLMKETGSRLAGDSGQVTYRMMTKKWFVVSGTNGTSIFYAKTVLSHDQFKSFEFTYSRRERTTYEPLVSRIAACFEDLAD